KDLTGCARVHIEVVCKGLDEEIVASEVRQEPKLDLAPVGGDQSVSRVGDEGLADPATLRGLYGRALQVRIGGDEPPGGSDGLLKGGVDAARGAVDFAL